MSLQTILDLFAAFHRTAAVKAGVELDVFTAIAEGVDTPGALATRCQAAERGIRILCDYLTSIGLLTKRGDRYGLGRDAGAFLDRRSPSYFGSMVTSVAGETNLQGFARLTAAVRRGGTALPARGRPHPGTSGLGRIPAQRPRLESSWVRCSRRFSM